MQYNPKKDTVEYLCDKNKVKFISEIYNYNNFSYFSEFFIKFYNSSVRFLSFFCTPQLENLDKFIPLKIFLTKEGKENYDIPDGLMGVNKSLLLKLLNKDKYGFSTESLIGIDKSFVLLMNDPNFNRKISFNNYFADLDMDFEAFNNTIQKKKL
jgi:hypothetical protein